MPEVVRLDCHVAELGETDSSLHPAADAFLLQHESEGEVLSGVPEEIHQKKLAEPVCVVPHPCGVRLGALEAEKSGELAANGRSIPVDLFEREDGPLVALSTGVTNHAGTRPDEDDRDVAGPL